MTARIYLLLFLIAIGSLCEIAHAQDVEGYADVNFTVKQGLPSNEIYNVVQDNEGFLWLGTDRGVVRYNYHEFKTYGLNEGLGNLLVVDMEFDQNGVLYVNCYDDGLYVYSKSEDRFKACKFQNFLKGKRINTYSFDEDNRLKLTTTYRFYKQLEVKDTVLVVVKDENIKSSQLFIDEDKAFFTPRRPPITNDPSYRHLGDHLLFDKLQIEYAEKMSENHFAFAAGKQVYIYNKQRDTLFELEVTSLYVRYAKVYGENWLCTDMGVMVLNDSFTSIDKILYPGVLVTDVCIDYEGVAWLSLHNRGVTKLIEQQGTVIYNYDDLITDLKVLDDKVYAMQIGALSHIEDDALKVDYFMDDYHYRIYNDNQNIFLRNNKVINYKSLELVNNYFDTESITAMTNDLDEEIQIDRHLRAVFKNRKQLTPVFWNGLALLGTRTTVVDNRVYVASPRDLYFVDYAIEDTFIHFGPPQIIKDSIRVSEMMVDGEVLWVSTIDNGLLNFNLSTSDVRSFFDEEKFPFRKVNNVSVYQDVVVLSTSKGVVVCNFDKDSNTLSIQNVFNSSNGLINTEVIDALLYNDSLHVAGEDGINIFPLSRAFRTHVRPKVALNQAIVLGDMVSFKSGTSLSNNRNNVRIEFSGLTNFEPFKDKMYAVSLYHNGRLLLSYFTGDRFAQFINLSNGSYRFEVKARNSANIWSKPELIEFVVEKHFTQKLWFITLIGLILASFIWAYVRRKAQLKIRELNVQKLINEKTILAQEASIQATNAKLGMFKSQVNPHFIYNALNSIQHLFFEDKKEEANTYIAMFSSLLRKGLNYSDLKRITLEEEIEYLKEYLELEKLRFPEKFTYEIICDDALLEEEVEIPPHLIQPIVENSIKHAFNAMQGPGSISIHINYSSNFRCLDVEVIDNGIGIGSATENSVHKSKGLQLIREHLKLINQNSEVSSELLLRDRSKLNPKESGTIVSFHVCLKSDAG